MNIEIGYPPVYDRLCQIFPIKDKRGILYCWSNTIFNPDNINIPEALIAHEEVHSKQQLEIGPDDWWDHFMIDAAKRLSYELPAHITEYKVYSEKFKDRNDRNRYLVACARRISSPMYGSCITFNEAMKKIKDA